MTDTTAPTPGPGAPAPYLEIGDDDCPDEASLRELLTAGHRFDAILEAVSGYINRHGRHTVRQDTDDFGKPVTVHEFATGGWSGVEEVISALGYTLGWRLSWDSSHSGGLHILRVTEAVAATEIPLGDWECGQLFTDPQDDPVDLPALTASLDALRHGDTADGLPDRGTLLAILHDVAELCADPKPYPAGQVRAAVARSIRDGIHGTAHS